MCHHLENTREAHLICIPELGVKQRGTYQNMADMQTNVLAHLSQWLHLNGFAPVCFLKCLVNSSLRAKRHSQPSHEHLYGFSPVERSTVTWLIEVEFRTRETQLFLLGLAGQSAKHCCHVNAFESITPGPDVTSADKTLENQIAQNWLDLFLCNHACNSNQGNWIYLYAYLLIK